MRLHSGFLMTRTSIRWSGKPLRRDFPCRLNNGTFAVAKDGKLATSSPVPVGVIKKITPTKAGAPQ